MTNEPKLFGEQTMADAIDKAADRAATRRRISPEIWGLAMGLLLTIGGWVWYASSLTTQTQAKAIAIEQLQKCALKTEFVQLQTRVDFAAKQTTEWRKEVKASLGEIKRTLKELSERMAQRPYYRRYRGKGGRR